VSARSACAALLLPGLVIALAGAAAVSRSADAPRDTAAPIKHGSVTLEPGYHGIVDPESASVRIGRRTNAPLVTKRFVGGAPTLDELGRRVCRALDYGVPDSLLKLCVREDEFTDIMWREFPQSRPATGIQAGDAWMFLWARLHGGSVQAVNEYGGHRYEFIRFDRYDTTAVYKNFKLYNGLVLVVRDDQGQVQQWRWLRSAVARKGSFKVYSTRD
jgi:hypothetical protein